MKKHFFSKKLSLKKQTIATLNNSEMDAVIAGTKLTEYIHTCYTGECTCPTTNKNDASADTLCI